MTNPCNYLPISIIVFSFVVSLILHTSENLYKSRKFFRLKEKLGMVIYTIHVYKLFSHENRY